MHYTIITKKRLKIYHIVNVFKKHPTITYIYIVIFISTKLFKSFRHFFIQIQAFSPFFQKIMIYPKAHHISSFHESSFAYLSLFYILSHKSSISRPQKRFLSLPCNKNMATYHKDYHKLQILSTYSSYAKKSSVMLIRWLVPNSFVV